MVTCWPCKKEDPSLIPGTHMKKLRVTVHAYNPSAEEAETGGCWGLLASLAYLASSRSERPPPPSLKHRVDRIMPEA